MIAVLWSELSAWGAGRSRQTLCTAVCVLASIGCLAMLRPEACLEGLTGVALWVGYLAGREIWSPVSAWKWVHRAGLPPGLVVAGRLLAAGLICLAHTFAVLPLLVLMTLVWGVPAAVLLEVGLIVLAGSGISAAFGLLGLHLGIGEDGFFSNILVTGWLILTAILPWFRPVNPFIQVWRALETAGLPRLLPSAGLFAILAWLAALLLRREVRPA